MNKHLVLTIAGILVSTALATSALASGLSKPVLIGSKAIGMGGAVVGIADDPTAIFHNPAGITQLEGYSFYAGMDGIITQEDYKPAGGGATESAKNEFLPVPAFGFTTDHLKPVYFGLGLFFPHGNGGKFTTIPSASPANPNEGRIYSMEIAPAIAWDVHPTFKVGASFRIVRVSESLKGQAFLLPSGLDMLENLDVSGWGVSASVGALYKPWDFLSFGLNYRPKLVAQMDGDATFTGAGVLAAEITQELPTLLKAGVAVKPIEKLWLGLQYEFENNSEIEATNGTLAGTAISLPQSWTDSHTILFGAEYLALENLAVRAGYGKDLTDSIPDAAMNRVVGDIAAHEISAGLGYTWKGFDFSAAWNARFGERTIPVSATNLAPGKYEAMVQSISVGIGTSL